MKRDSVEQYTSALRFFITVLREPPDEALLRRIVNDELFERFGAWGCFRPVEAEKETCDYDPGHALRHLQDICSPPPGRDADEFYGAFFQDLCEDHRDLLSGPSPSARPWESFWIKRIEGPRTAPTERLRQWYHDWGVSTEGKADDDLLWRELAFVLHLLRATVETPDAVSSWKQPPRAALADFMNQHILPWAGFCLNKASEEASTVFFRELPKLCCVMLENLRSDLAAETG